MSTPLDLAPDDDRELVLGRVLRAPRHTVYRCWTEPELMVRWFAPAPWTCVSAQTDVRPGGRSLVVMRGPDGTQVPAAGVYLEVDPGARIVFTDAFTDAWTPSAKPFMAVQLDFEDALGGATRYVARARHWTAQDRAAHEAMGFHAGWGLCADQLEALAATL